MTELQEQKISRYIQFRDYFVQFPLENELPSHLKNHYENFLYHLELILKIRDMIEENKKNAENYSFVRNEVIQFTLFLSRKVTSYALLEELIEVQGLLSYSYDYLINEPDFKLLEHCKNLLLYISSCESELADYAIDHTTINSYHDLIDRFQLIIECKVISDEMENDESNKFHELFNKAGEIFERELSGLNAMVVSRTST